MKKPENSLAALSAAMDTAFEERNSKVNFSRKLFYDLNLQPSDQVDSMSDSSETDAGSSDASSDSGSSDSSGGDGGGDGGGGD